MLLHERVTARLDGTPLPELPDASKVSADQLKEIIGIAGSKKPSEVHPFLKTLTNHERAAWIDWLAEPEGTDPPKSIVQLRSTIVSSSKTGKAASSPTVHFPQGTELSPSTLKAFVDKVAAKPADYSRLNVFILPANLGPGLQSIEMRHENITDKKNTDQFYQHFETITSSFESDSMPEDIEAVISAQFYATESQSAMWWVKGGKAEPSDDITPLMEAIGKGRTGPYSQFTVAILTRADAEAFLKSQEEE